MNQLKYIQRSFLTLLLLTLLCTSARAQNPTPAADQDKPIALTGATIHVGNGTVIENGT
ncbi:MAG: hypothetical protein ACI92C_001403, partial [Neolewinella sp.]